MTVLFHPGSFHNPEYPQFDGAYRGILADAYAGGARSWTPSELLAQVAEWERSRGGGRVAPTAVVR